MEGIAKVKIYFMAVFDLQLFFVAILDGVEHWVRLLALLGGIIVTVFTIRKMIQDYDIHKVDMEIKKQQLENLKKQNSNGVIQK